MTQTTRSNQKLDYVRLSKIYGTLFGLTWGDVFGCPVEMWTKEEIRKHYEIYSNLPKEYPESVLNDPQRSKRLRPLGQYSDDTQQALALLHCTHQKEWNPQSWADILLLGMRRRAWRGYGKRFSGSIENLSKGVSPHQSGVDSAGIGAAMRIAPLGLLYPSDSKQLIKVSMESSLVTHANINAAVIAFTVSFIIAKLVENQNIFDILDILPEKIRSVELQYLNNKSWEFSKENAHLISDIFQEICDIIIGSIEINLSQQSSYDTIRDSFVENTKKAFDLDDYHVNSGISSLGGIHAISKALYGIAKINKTNPIKDLKILATRSILIDIIAEGGDTDTVAAIAGAILGAAYGLDWVFCDRITECDIIFDYASAIVQGTPLPETRDQFLCREKKITENQYIIG